MKYIFRFVFISFMVFPLVSYGQTYSSIDIDYSIDEGESYQVASGLLHGISDSHPAQYLIDGINVRSIRGADYHIHLPSYYDLDIYERAEKTGAQLMIGLYYYITDSSYWPGDNGDWDTWRDIVRSVYNEAQEKDLDIYSWITWNEPQLQWGSRGYQQYFEAHNVAYDTVKALDPQAKVQAPENHNYNYGFITDFLTYCKENDCLPDVLAWHELSPDPIDIEAHTREINGWMRRNDITPMPIAITEYQGITYRNDHTSIPGVNVYYLASLERAAKWGLEYGLHANWTRVGSDPDYIATLSDMADRDTATLPRGMWWSYNAYKDMTGRKVAVSVNGANSDALGSTDEVMKRSIILVGTRNYFTPHNVDINLRNLPHYLHNQNKVHVRAELIRDGNIVMAPEVVLAADFTLEDNGLALTLPTLEPKAAYMLHISPAMEAADKNLYEAERLRVRASRGSVVNTVEESEASAGKISMLESSATEEYVKYIIPAPGEGVYNLQARVKGLADGGFAQLYIEGKSMTPPEDLYRETEQYYTNDFGNIYVGPGDLALEFKVVGKNPGASGARLAFDNFVLNRLSDSSKHPRIKGKKKHSKRMITMEAESAISIAPFVKESSRFASGKQYIVWPNNGTDKNVAMATDFAPGRASYRFFLAEPSSIKLSATVSLPGEQDNAFYFKLNNESFRRLERGPTRGWQTIELAKYRKLPAGMHTVVLTPAVDGAKIDALHVSSSRGSLTDLTPSSRDGNSLVIESESLSDIAPLQVQSDADASGAAFVLWPNNGSNQYLADPNSDSSGQMVYRFSLSQASSVSIDVRLNLPVDTDDSFYYRFDDGEFIMQNDRQTQGWEVWNLGSYLSLPAGEHQLVIQRREDGAQFDYVRVSASEATVSDLTQ